MAVRTGSYTAVREAVLTRLEQARTDQSVLHRPCIKKSPDELQQPLVLDAFGDLAHQFVMIDSIEEFFQIEINHPAVALRNIPLRLCHGVMRRPTRPEPLAVW